MLIRRLRPILPALVPLLVCTHAFASEPLPIQVKLTVSQPPIVGQAGTVTATVTTDYDLPNVSLKIELPTEGKVTAGATTTFAKVQGGVPAVQTATVQFSKPGNKLVRAVVLTEERPGVVWSAVDYLGLDVGSSVSRVGLGAETEPTTVQVSPGTGKITGPAPLNAPRLTSSAVAPVAPVTGPNAPAASPASDPPPTPGTLTLSGSWHFNDRDGVYTPMRQVLCELVRGDDHSHLAYAYTAWDGSFTFPAVANPGTAGVHIICSTWTDFGSGNFLSVIDAGGDQWDNRYTAWTDQLTFSDGAQNAGGWMLVDAWAYRKAWWIHDDYIKAYYVPQLPAGGVDLTGRHVGRWTPTSTDGTYYNFNQDAHYAAGDADNTPDTILHEMGHSVMYNIYGGDFPSSPNCNPHYLMGSSSTGCGWTEGWAQTWHCWTTGNAIRSYPGGGGINLETATWGDGYDEGDTVEGRVAGAIWDITDSTNEGYDQYSGDWANVWWIMRNRVCDTFSQFWSEWKTAGYTKHGPVASIYQSTIDYDTAPTFAGLPDVTRNENTTNNNIVDLWLYASDPESADSQLTYTITGNTNSGVGVSIDSSGYLDINPNPHFYGSSTVTIKCSDGPKSDYDTLVVTITRVDDPPSISDLPDKILSKNTTWSHAIDLWSYASDAYDADSALTYTITGNTGPSAGVSISSNRYIDINPTANWTGESHVTVQVADPDGSTASDTFVVVVGNRVASCAEARTYSDGSWICFSYLGTVTANFSGAFYMEDWNRLSGTRVAYASTAPVVGNYAYVAGQLTSYYGERSLDAHIVMDYGVDSTPPAPLYIQNNVLGGKARDSYTRSVPEGTTTGCYNVGLLARTSGTVVKTGSTVCWIDDGSHAVYSTTTPALYCDWSAVGVPAPPLGARVAVTGISGCATLSGNTIAKFRPRTTADVQGLGGRAAYIYSSDSTTATAFGTLLDDHGWRMSKYSTSRFPISLAGFDVIIVGADTDVWTDLAKVARVVDSGRPVIALGSGGAKFLDAVTKPDLSIGWGPSASGSANTGYVLSTSLGVWYFDQPLTIPSGNIITIQSSGGAIEVYDPPTSVTRILRDPTLTAYWPIAQEDRFMQWGYGGGPSAMSATGQDLFVNCLYYMQGK